MSQDTPSTVSDSRLLDCLYTKLKSGEIGEDAEYFAELLLRVERRAVLRRYLEKKNAAENAQSSM